LGFDESSLKQIKQIAIRYGDVVGVGAAERNSISIFNRNDDSNNNNNNNSKRMSITKDFVNKAFQAFNKFADMSAIESQIKNLQRKRTDVEAALNKVNSDYAHLQSLIAMWGDCICVNKMVLFEYSLTSHNSIGKSLNSMAFL
jgi:hypothetical protein